METSLSNKGCIKEFADKLRITNSAINSYQTDIKGVEENISKMEKEKIFNITKISFLQKKRLPNKTEWTKEEDNKLETSIFSEKDKKKKVKTKNLHCP